MTEKIFVTDGRGASVPIAARTLRKRDGMSLFITISRAAMPSLSSGRTLVAGGLLDRDSLTRVMAEHKSDAVACFTALTYVGKSTAHPTLYYRTNSTGALNLLDAMSLPVLTSLKFPGPARNLASLPGCQLTRLPQNARSTPMASPS